MNSRSPRSSLRLKLILAFAFISLAVSAVATFSSYQTLQIQNLEGFRSRVLDAISIIALDQNGDEFLQVDSEKHPFYEKILLQNTRIKETNPDYVYLYTMRKDEQGIYFVVDAGDPSAEGFSPYGERYLEPSPYLVGNWDTLTDPIVEPALYSDEYGSFISAYAPIKTSVGSHVGVVGIDISADTILGKQRQLLFQSIFNLLLAGGLGILTGYVAGGIFNRPLRKLSEATTRVAQGDLTARTQLKTGDEIEELGNALNSMADKIQDMVDSLERSVSERTEELVSSRQVSEKRAKDLQTVAEVARHISTEKDLGKLLPLITHIVSDRFSFYHAGIFLVDEIGKYAVLRASNSPGGQAMLKRKHSLEVGQKGIVGYVTGTGSARLALNTGDDSVYFNNPDLPDTRSEVAVPLIIRGKVIGALDVQSTQANAFTDADVAIFSLLADQIAIAIDNAKLLEETQAALAESQAVFREYLATSWQDKIGSAIVGYHQSLEGGRTITFAESAEVESIPPDEPGVISVPIRVRNQEIGVLNIRTVASKRKWDQDEVAIVQAVAEHLGLTLDNARLFEETSSRASRERLVTEITSKIRSTNDPQEMMKAAVEQLQHVLGASRVEIVPQKPGPSTG
jgi:GAF domain-containing protein/HAMP domain-containing protein